MRVDADSELRWENMLAGIRAQAGWLAHGPREALDGARCALEGPPPTAVYLVGCGDSHYCGVAAQHAFEAWSGAPVNSVAPVTVAACPSMEIRAPMRCISDACIKRFSKTVSSITECPSA